MLVHAGKLSKAGVEALLQRFPGLGTPCCTCSRYFAPFELFLMAEVESTVLLVSWTYSGNTFKSLSQCLGRWGNTDTDFHRNSLLSPKHSSWNLILKHPGLCLVPRQGPKQMCDSALRQACSYQCGEAAGMTWPRVFQKTSTSDHCRSSVSLGPQCLSARCPGADSFGCISVSLSILHLTACDITVNISFSVVLLWVLEYILQ